MKVAAIVPVKTFERAKSRLHIGRDDTSKLCTLMLGEVLSALVGSAHVGSVAIVSREPLAENAASEFGAELVRDESESGVNDAVALGVRHYAGRGFDGTLVIPQDLPLLLSEDVDTIVELSGRMPCVTIVPSRSLDGTNALLRAPSDLMPTRYDEGSYLAHMGEARAQNLNPVLVYQRRAMADIDSIKDVAYCARLGEKPHVCRQIAQLTGTDFQI